jgi:valyl-tRNA synthetase
MPFITEELWAVTAQRDGGLLALAPWSLRESTLTDEQLALIATTSPNAPLIPPILLAFDAADFSDPAAEAEIGWVVDLVTAIRSVRAEMNIPPATLMPLTMAGSGQDARARVERWSDAIKRLARVGDIGFDDQVPSGAIQLLVRDEAVALPLKGVIDLSAEKARLTKEVSRAEADIKRVDAKLSNEKFVSNAPEEIVEEEKEKRDAAIARKEKNTAALRWLENAM